MKTKQTFKKGKTITELGIDINKKFEVIEGYRDFKKGDILELIEDDGSNYPEFKNQNGKKGFIYLNWLTYANEDNEIKNLDLVGVSNYSQEMADRYLRKDAYNYYIGKTKQGKYIIQNENGDFEICKYISNKKPEEKKKVILELTDEQLEEIKKIIN